MEDNKTSWPDANKYCQERGAHLVDFASSGSDFEFIRTELKTLEIFTGERNCWWVGGTDMGRESLWYWVHSLSSSTSYVDWYEGSPNLGLEGNYMCLCHDKDYFASDCYTNGMMNFICKKQDWEIKKHVDMNIFYTVQSEYCKYLELKWCVT